MNCAQFEKRDGTNLSADWGTAAHELAAWCIRTGSTAQLFRATSIVVPSGARIEVDEEMVEQVAFYLATLRELHAPHTFSWTEHPLSIEHLTGEEGAVGTADYLSYRNGEVTIADLKTGQHTVSPESPQLMVYLLAAVDLLGEFWDVKSGRTVVVMSRHRRVHVAEHSLEDIEAFRDAVKQAAARYSKAQATPSYDGCKWCAKSGECEAQTRWAEAQLPAVTGEAAFDDLDAVRDDLARRYEALPLMEHYITAVRKAVYKRCLDGDASVPYKLVAGRNGPRRWADQGAALAALSKIQCERNLIGMLTEVVPRTPKQVMLALGKAKMSEAFSDLIPLTVASEGKLQIVSSDDPRPAIRSQLFEDVTEEGDTDAL